MRDLIDMGEERETYSESEQEGRLSNTRVSNKEHFEKIVAIDSLSRESFAYYSGFIFFVYVI